MMFRGWFIILQTLNVAARFEKSNVQCRISTCDGFLQRLGPRDDGKPDFKHVAFNYSFIRLLLPPSVSGKKNQTTKPQLYCQGVKWYSSGEPPEGYIFSTTNVSGHTSEMKPVSAAEDFRIPSLLLWMYNYFVHKMPGDTVVSNEETIYLVRECTLETQPDWLARAQCFDVWDQQEVTVIFKLKNPK